MMSLPVHHQGCLNCAGLVFQCNCVFEFFFLALNYYFFMFFNRFDILISKINFKNKNKNIILA
jgi:hypothetical protein